jgi:ABC-type phosphate/phosphonate transport system substrate-binding protein
MIVIDVGQPLVIGLVEKDSASRIGASPALDTEDLVEALHGDPVQIAQLGGSRPIRIGATPLRHAPFPLVLVGGIVCG